MIEIPSNTPNSFFQSLSTELTRVLHPLDGDRSNHPIHGYRPPGQGLDYIPPRIAGVLLPILCHPDGATMLFTGRSMSLGNHPGQVSFPGGGIELVDNNEVEASVRETQEEVGIEPTDVSPLGVLDYFDTISGYRVLPVVALVKPQVSLVLDSKEVSESFEVPLHKVLDRSRYQVQKVEYSGQYFEMYSSRWKKHTIWGATAAMLIDLIDKLENTNL